MEKIYFVVMPFSKDHLEPVYHDHIKAVAVKLSLSRARADDFFSIRNIMDDISEAICGAKLIIADCSYKNPNVFYGLGLAHAIGKPVILITRKADDVPFGSIYKHVESDESVVIPCSAIRFAGARNVDHPEPQPL